MSTGVFPNTAITARAREGWSPTRAERIGFPSKITSRRGHCRAARPVRIAAEKRPIEQALGRPGRRSAASAASKAAGSCIVAHSLRDTEGDLRVNPGQAHTQSFWAATANASSDHSPLEGDRSCDVCVIGGGYTGLSAALHLAKRGYEVVLLEAHRVGWGASGRNGGQLGSAHAKLQPTLIEKYGADMARALWDLAEDAKALVKGLIDEHQIDCDYAPGNTACAVTSSDFDYLCEHVDIAARDYGYEAYEILDRAEIAEISGSVCYEGA
ncbi:MAG: FAD-binding oxidoreductase, partial [Deltaproteobacteria bacterium]|nr:FAD-binding oxidoreductase [Deltaproteobacteria bacterium]